MKYLLFVALLLGTIGRGFTQTHDKKFAAIIIGNGAYMHPEFPVLNYSSDDVSRMKNLCQELKFDTCIVVYNLKRADPFFKINLPHYKSLFKKRKITDVLFYYTGHGLILPDRGESFLIPTEFTYQNVVDTYVKQHADVKLALNNLLEKNPPERNELLNKLSDLNILKNTIPVSSVCDSLKDFRLMFISDACRNPVNYKQSTSAKAVSITDDTFLKNWIKAIGNANNSRQQLFVTNFKAFCSSLDQTIKQFQAHYTDFEKSHSNGSVRKPLSILYGTNYKKTAAELASATGGLFTNCLTNVIRNQQSPYITFDDDFVNNSLNTCMKSTGQEAALEGVGTFKTLNPFIKNQLINKTNIDKAFEKNTFQASSMVLKGIPDKQDQNLTKFRSIIMPLQGSRILSWPGFEELFKDSITAGGTYKVELKSRIVKLSVLVENDTFNFYCDEEFNIPEADAYKFNRSRSGFTLIPASTVTGTTSLKIPHSFSAASGFSLNDGGSLNLTSSLSFPSLIDFSEVEVKRISANYDTIEVQIPSLFEPYLNVKLVHAKNLKIVYSGSNIHYPGSLNSEGNKVVSNSNYPKDPSYYPANKALPFKWKKNGIYKATLNIRAELTPETNTLSTNEASQIRSDFFTLHVNDITQCADATLPNASGAACFTKLNEVKVPFDDFKANKVISVPVNFEILVADPTKKSISLPFCFKYDRYLNNIVVESVSMQCEKEYDFETSRRMLDEIETKRKAAESAALRAERAQREAAAELSRVAELKKYEPANFVKVYYRRDYEFHNNIRKTYFDSHYGVNFDSYQIQNNRLELARGYLFYSQLFSPALANNYQIDAKLSFGTDQSRKQYFFWEGFADDGVCTGYYITPEKNSTDYYLNIGFRKQDRSHIDLGRIKLGYASDNSIKKFFNEEAIRKITIRKFGDKFYFFFDEQHIGVISDSVRERGQDFFLYNMLPRHQYNQTPTQIMLPADQLNYAGSLILESVKVSEIAAEVI